MLAFAQQTNLLANDVVAKLVPFTDLDDDSGQQITETMLQKHYDEFYEEVFFEIEDKYGEIEEMNVCENLGDHIVGNVYIKFYKEEDAEKACEAVNDRWFAQQ